MDGQNAALPTKKKTRKQLTLAQAEEQYLSSISSSTAVLTATAITSSKSKKVAESAVKMKKTKSEHQTIKTQVITSSTTTKRESVNIENTTNNIKREVEEISQVDHDNGLQQNEDGDDLENGDVTKKNNVAKKKNKLKKNKKGETEKQNISVKSSFSKFDALQKRNLIHNPQGDVQTNCRLCNKAVYKMEEIKAEKNIYHRNCFRCHECKKQLKVDTYQSHEGTLYCTVHFKLLFSPKCVEDNDNVQPRKPELIIRENQPTELPPDVVRASDKPDLGLEELQQLNVRSRFQVFEQGQSSNNDDEHDLQKSNNVAKRSASILSKVAKLQQLSAGGSRQTDASASSDNDEDDDEERDDDFDLESDNPNADLIRQKKREQKRERPIGLGEAMNDIRTLFEKGHCVTKEERREERKQEIQNIRSRLFMGKQARIKEMYQQAVADSEHASDKKSNIDIEVDSKSLRERFENGEVFKDNSSVNENDGDGIKKGAIEKEADIFESAISKKSRSIFMELDANVVNGKNHNILPSKSGSRILQHQKSSGSIGGQSKVNELDGDIVKCGEAVEDVKIQTSEISEKFKFFETYHPTESEKRVFRITPPREGVVKMPAPDENLSEEATKEISPDRNIIAHSRTTSMMLNKFRELEKNPNRNAKDDIPKPLKCFTPPPDGNRRLFVEQDSDEYDSNEDDDDEEDDDDSDEDGDNINHSHLPKDDEALREAQQAARAKQLRLKFEKWQANEVKREKDNELQQNIYANNNLDDNSIESTQSIRARFENMQNLERQSQPTRPRYQVNRFV